MKRFFWVPAALLLILAAALLYGGRRLPAGVSESKTPLGILYSPGAGPGPEALTLPEDEDGHTHALTGGGSAALVLSGRGEGARGLAIELARRGVSVLTASESADAGEAWTYLTGREFVRIGTVALIAGPSRSGEALALAGELAGLGRECAALLLSGEDELLSAAAGSPARNILYLSVSEPSAEAAGAFLGDEDGPGEIRGYFAEGTARSVIAAGTARLDARETMLPVIDWLGSSLGHAVELHDEDLTVPGRRAMSLAGELVLLAAAGFAATALGMTRADHIKKRKTKNNGSNTSEKRLSP